MDNSKKQNAKFLGNVISDGGTIENEPKIVKIIYFQGMTTGIEDIDCPPDYDSQGRDYLEDEVWVSQPTPYEP